MRISDWSSDVCSSDLLVYDATLKLIEFDGISNVQFRENWRARDIERINAEHGLCIIRGSNYFSESNDLGDLVDRKSVVSGKSVSVRVGLGGRRIIKTKNPTQHYHDTRNIRATY